MTSRWNSMACVMQVVKLDDLMVASGNEMQPSENRPAQGISTMFTLSESVGGVQLVQLAFWFN